MRGHPRAPAGCSRPGSRSRRRSRMTYVACSPLPAPRSATRIRTVNDTSVSADIGISRLFDAGSVSGGLRMGRRWSAGERFHSSLGPWAQVRRRYSGSTEIDMALSSMYRTHDGRSRPGWMARRREPSSAAHPEQSDLDGGRADLRMGRGRGGTTRGSRLIGIGATLSRAFDGGLSVVFHTKRPRAATCRQGPAVRGEAGWTRMSVSACGCCTAPFGITDSRPTSASLWNGTGPTSPSANSAVKACSRGVSGRF